MALGQLQNEGDLQRWLQDQLGTVGLSQPDAGVQDKSIGKGKLATDALNAFLKLATAADRHVAFGTTNVTWPGATTFSSTASVAHGLGTTPLVVLVTDNGGGTLAHIPIFSAFSYGATTFGVNAETGDLSSPAAATSRNFAWVAIG